MKKDNVDTKKTADGSNKSMPSGHTQIRVQMTKTTELINDEESEEQPVKIIVHEKVLIQIPIAKIREYLVWLYEKTKAISFDAGIQIVWRNELDEEEREKVRILRNLYMGFKDGAVEPLIDIREMYAEILKNNKLNVIKTAMSWLHTKTGKTTFKEAYEKVKSIYCSGAEDLTDNDIRNMSLIEEIVCDFNLTTLSSWYKNTMG